MRQKLLTKAAVCCMLLFTCTVMAENTDISSLKNVLYISPVTVPQGTTDYILSVKMRNEMGADGYANAQGFTFYIQLPESFSFALNGDGNPDVQLSTLRTNSDQIDVFQPQIKDDGRLYVLAGVQEGDGYITEKDGEVVLVHITLPGNAAVGDYTIVVAEPTVSPATGGSPKREIAAVETTLTIAEPADSRTTLSEDSISAPEASDGAVDVLVKRTINANLWSTICLPFGMTEAQMKEAFGNDVELADFVGCDVTYTDETEENVQSINVKFESVAAIEANHPYIIKVSENIAEFTADDVIISPDEASVDCDPYAYTVQVGKNKYETRYFYNSFVGTYVSNFFVPEQCLFLNGNQFWYSTGLTKMKAFRAYFDFYDVLTAVENYEVKMFVGGLETKVEGMNERNVQGTIFDLSGRKVTKPQQRGIYIVNGKKAIIK